MERWKDLQPPPTTLAFSEQPVTSFFGASALDPTQLQRVGINDLALIQRQLHQYQAGTPVSNADRIFHPSTQPPIVQSATTLNPIARTATPLPASYIAPTLTTQSPSNFSGASLAGSATTSPTPSRYIAEDSFATSPHGFKKQKVGPSPVAPQNISPLSPLAATQPPPAPMPLLHNAPVQMSITREHTLKLAEKAMDDVSTLIKFLAANEPQLLAVSNLTAAHHLISRFVAGIQKTKHTSGGPQPGAPATVSALPQSLAGHYLEQQHTVPQPSPATVAHLPPSATAPAPLHAPIPSSIFSQAQQQQYLHSLAAQQHQQQASVLPQSAVVSSSSTLPTSTLSSSAGVAMIRESEPLPERCSLTDFTVLDVLGTGTFGKVRLCMFKPTGRYYCMKILSKEKIIRLKQEEHILNEKSVLQSARNPFIIRLYHTFQDRNCLFFLMEYASGGELFTCIRRASRLSNTTAKFYAAEIILAISYLHAQNIVHRDLKPENLLLDAQGHIKLTDFGFAKHVTDRTYTMCGTPEYIAPEVILSKGHGKGADWWSLGVLIYEMLAGHPPFYGDSNHTVFEKILSNRPIFPSHFDTLAKDIIDRLLVVDVEKRLGCGPDGVDEIKRHPWFQGTSWEAILQRQVPGPINPRTTAENDTRNFAKYGELPEDAQEFKGENDIFKNF